MLAFHASGGSSIRRSKLPLDIVAPKLVGFGIGQQVVNRRCGCGVKAAR
jgi:hypothetical protein